MSETPIWPFLFRDDAHVERVTALLDAYKMSRLRTDRYLASPAHQNRVKYFSRLQADVKELVNDLYEAERDYYHISLFNGLVNYTSCKRRLKSAAGGGAAEKCITPTKTSRFSGGSGNVVA